MRSPSLLSFLFLALNCFYSSIIAQTPGFNYQAVLRDAQGQPMANQNLTLHILLTDGPDGALLYQESHDVSTNELGLINVTVGSGLLESGAFDSIIGVPDLYYEIQAELAGGAMEDLGGGPVGAAPYALYGKDEDSDPANEIQNLLLDGDSLGIEGGLGVSLSSFVSPWEILPDTSGYFLSLPPSLTPDPDNNRSFQNEDIARFGVSNTFFDRGGTVEVFSEVHLNTPEPNIFRSTKSNGVSKNDIGDTEFLNSFSSGLFNGMNVHSATDNQFHMGWNLSGPFLRPIIDGNFDINLDYTGFQLGTNLGGFSSSFFGLTSLNPLIPDFDYNLPEIIQLRLNNQIGEDATTHTFKHESKFGPEGEQTEIAIGQGTFRMIDYYTPLIGGFDASRSLSYGDDRIRIKLGVDYEQFSGSKSTELLRVPTLSEILRPEFDDILTNLGIGTEMSALISTNKLEGDDQQGGWNMGFDAVLDDGTTLSYTGKISDYTLNSCNGRNQVYGQIDDQGNPVNRRATGIDENEQTGMEENFSVWNNPEGNPGVGITVGSSFPFSGRSQGIFGGTLTTLNNLGISSVLGALPGLDPTIPIMLLFRGASPIIIISSNSENASQTTHFGANGSRNSVISNIGGQPNRGAILIYGEQGDITRGAFYVDEDERSILEVDEVVMLSASPGRSDEAIAYGALAGGEMGAYDRGTGQLVNGEAYIQCPEHFQQVADPLSMTVTVTPLSADSKGIAVVEKTLDGFRVKELFNGTGNYSFDYMITCKRKGYESYEVMRQRPEPAEDVNIEPFLKNVAGKQWKSITDIGDVQRNRD